MADSKRLVVLKTLSQFLRDEIKTANGYQHTLAAVSRGRLFISDTEALPMISILENFNPDREPAEVGGHQGRGVKDNWVLLLQGWAADDKANPSDPAHLLMADTKKALAKIVKEDGPQYMFGGLIANMHIEPGVIRPPTEASPRAYFYLRVVVEVTEYLDDPYRLD